MREMEEIREVAQPLPASAALKVSKSWNSSRFLLSLMHLIVTKCFLAFSAIIFYLNFISFFLIMVPFLRVVNTLPRHEGCALPSLSLTISLFLLLPALQPSQLLPSETPPIT